MSRPTRYRAVEFGEQLTERELDVLHLVAQGHSNAEIGRRLFLGENTIKTHLARVSTKLGTEGRVASVVALIATGKLQASYDFVTGLRVTR